MCRSYRTITQNVQLLFLVQGLTDMQYWIIFLNE